MAGLTSDPVGLPIETVTSLYGRSTFPKLLTLTLALTRLRPIWEEKRVGKELLCAVKKGGEQGWEQGSSGTVLSGVIVYCRLGARLIWYSIVGCYSVL